MRYAIDRYEIGVETEVSASDFDEKRDIPQRLTRFFCPECNEQVFFRAKGGAHPSQFYHQIKTNSTPECDKRVDGHSNLTISQRVGLPIFIKQISLGHFQLNIGFPALGLKTLEYAAKYDCIATISSYQNNRTIKVNQTNFLSDDTTLIPVDFIPLDGMNYSIAITGRIQIIDLKRKWSDYADGFEISGAVFLYGETGGKKIRRGDSISTNRYYYAVVLNEFLQHPKIDQDEVGKLKIGEITYKVIKYIVKVSTKDEYNFKLINSYLHSKFGVWLLECPSEIIPIWPPVVQQQDYMIPVKSNSNLVCVVSSGNDQPSVFVYSSKSACKKDIKTTINGVHIVELSVGSFPTILSVDRKYAGREVTYIAKTLNHSNYEYAFSCIDSSGYKKRIAEISQREVSKGFIVESNSKFDLYLGTDDMKYGRFYIRDKHTTIPAHKGINEVCLFIGSNIYSRITFKKDILQISNINDISERIIGSAKGTMIPIPLWINYILQYLKNNNFDKLYYSIVKTLINGKIHLETVRQLRIIFGNNINKLKNEKSERYV